MGAIIAAYDLFPESTDVDLNAIIAGLKDLLPAGVEFTDDEPKILPVAFGLMKVNAVFKIDDSDDTIGGKLEEALRGIAGIDNVECVSSTVL